LDSLLLLGFVLKKPQEWLLAHDDFELSGRQIEQLDLLQTRRANDEPMAYLLGYKECYGRKFIVTPDVLIPRPETEQLVDEVGQLLKSGQRIIDVGCGSGCIGITLKLERPDCDVTLSDISPAALKVAKRNAERLKTDVKFVKSDLLKSFAPSQKFDVIIANLPYVDKTWTVSPETAHEPATALFADDGGAAVIKKLIGSARGHLNNPGHLILELDPRQAETVKNYAAEHGFKAINQSDYLLHLSSGG
jgi:release factor glutamine methyltransferase